MGVERCKAMMFWPILGPLSGAIRLGPCWQQLSCRFGENIHCALENIGDGGEVDLDGGFGETSPSHSARSVTALPRSEDLLDPATHAMNWLVPFMELAQRFVFITTPHAGSDDPGHAAPCADLIAKVTAAIGAVGKRPRRDCRVRLQDLLCRH